MTMHNFSTQYNTEQFYLQTTIIAQMLSIGEEGEAGSHNCIEQMTFISKHYNMNSIHYISVRETQLVVMTLSQPCNILYGFNAHPCFTFLRQQRVYPRCYNLL